MPTREVIPNPKKPITVLSGSTLQKLFSLIDSQRPKPGKNIGTRETKDGTYIDYLGPEGGRRVPTLVCSAVFASGYKCGVVSPCDNRIAKSRWLTTTVVENGSSQNTYSSACFFGNPGDELTVYSINTYLQTVIDAFTCTHTTTGSCYIEQDFYVGGVLSGQNIFQKFGDEGMLYCGNVASDYDSGKCGGGTTLPFSILTTCGCGNPPVCLTHNTSSDTCYVCTSLTSKEQHYSFQLDCNNGGAFGTGCGGSCSCSGGSGYYDGTRVYSNEYTTGLLIETVLNALRGAPYPSWYTVSTGPRCGASWMLDESELGFAAGDFRYKFTSARPPPAGSVLIWIERFTPNLPGGITTPVVDTIKQFVWSGTQTETPVYQVLHPTSNGGITIRGKTWCVNTGSSFICSDISTAFGL